MQRHPAVLFYFTVRLRIDRGNVVGDTIGIVSHDDTTLDRVAVSAHGHHAGGQFETFERSESSADAFAVEGFGIFESVKDHLHSFVGQFSVGVRQFIREQGNVVVDEFNSGRFGGFGGESGDISNAFGSGAGDLGNFRSIGRVTADDRGGDTASAGLLDFQTEFDVQVRQKENISVFGSQFGQLNVVVLDIGTGIFFGSKNFTTKSLEAFGEGFGQTDSVSISVVEHDDSGLVALTPAVVGGNFALDRVEEAGAENGISGLGNQFIGGESGNVGAAGVLGNRTGGEGALGGVRTNDGDDFFFFNQFLISVDGLFFRAFGIGNDEFNRIFNALDFNFAAELIFDDLSTMGGVLPSHSSGTGHRESETDFDRVFSLSAYDAAEDHNDRQHKNQCFFHNILLLPYGETNFCRRAFRIVECAFTYTELYYRIFPLLSIPKMNCFGKIRRYLIICHMTNMTFIRQNRNIVSQCGITGFDFHAILSPFALTNGNCRERNTTLMPKGATVQVLDRGLDIIEQLAVAEKGMSIQELSLATDLPKPTIHRILATFTERHYVEKDPETSIYSLGAKFVDITSLYLNKIALKTEAEPIMRRLANAFNASAFLGTRDGVDVVYLSCIEPINSIRIYTQIGKREPVYCTALGKVLLSAMNPNDLNHLGSQISFKALTPQTLTDFGALKKDVDDVRVNGYAIDHGEHTVGSSCLAVPIYDYSKRIIAAMSISGYGLLENNPIDTLYREMKAAAADLSGRMGYRS